MDKIIVAIGGGEIKNKTTLKIDKYVADLAKKHSGEKRANALFFGTASHDSMPYFNSFRKTYTSVFDIKAEVALLVYGEMNIEHIEEKIENADCIYVGGGDTVFMIDKWKETGIDKLLLKAYESGKIICGLSAGAICWFQNMYTDYEIMRNESGEYAMKKGMGVLEGTICPHYNERRQDFFETMLKKDIQKAYCIENDCAVVFVNGQPKEVVSSGGKAYVAINDNGQIKEIEML
mgnify:CR=1 FL=1